MKKPLLILAAASALGLGGVAIAAGHMAGGGHRMDMSKPMTLQDIETRVKDHFAKLDTNKDGVVEKAEADAARTKMRGERRAERFAMLDANKDGSISQAEFDAAHAARAEGKPDGDGRKGMGRHHGHGGKGGMRGMGGRGDLFTRADANNDGKVTLAEALTKPTEHFKMMDANKDGTVTPEERKAAHEKMRAEWKAKRAG